MPMQKRPTIDLMAGLNCLFKVRDGGKKACSAHVNLGTSAGTGAL